MLTLLPHTLWQFRDNLENWSTIILQYCFASRWSLKNSRFVSFPDIGLNPNVYGCSAWCFIISTINVGETVPTLHWGCVTSFWGSMPFPASSIMVIFSAQWGLFSVHSNIEPRIAQHLMSVTPKTATRTSKEDMASAAGGGLRAESRRNPHCSNGSTVLEVATTLRRTCALVSEWRWWII